MPIIHHASLAAFQRAMRPCASCMRHCAAKVLSLTAEGSHACASCALQEVVSLVPWMQTLFDLADAGMTTFDVSGSFWPYCKLNSLFAAKADANPFDGVEKVLGTFKRRSGPMQRTAYP